MLFLVQDILPVIADKSGGTGLDLCSTHGRETALRQYNRINEVLMTRQDWPGTEAEICLPVWGGAFSLPGRFEAIKALRVDGGPLPILPMGFKYLEGGPGELTACGPSSKALTHLGSHFPTARDLPRPLPLFAICQASESITMDIHGTTADGRTTRIKINASTAYPDRAPIHSTASLATITSVTKPRTTGYVELCAWDDATGEALWLTCLEPADTTPSFTRYLLSGRENTECHLKALVSCAYREIWDPSEVSIIQAREPYRLMSQALNHFDRSETALGAEFQNRAMKLLKERASKLTRGQAQALPFKPHHSTSRRYSIRGF